MIYIYIYIYIYVLFDSTLSFIPHITAIYLELEKYENKLLYLLLKL